MTGILKRLRNLAIALATLGLIAMGFSLIQQNGIPALGLSPASIGNTSCKHLQIQAEGLALKNQLGGSFTVLKAMDTKEIQRTNYSLTCTSKLILDNGKTGDFTLSAKYVDDEIFLTVAEKTP